MDKESKKKNLPESQEPIKQKNFPDKSEAAVNITFREHRKFDLHVGRKMIIFKGRETKPVPKSWLDHADFKQVEKLFIKKGV